MPKSSPSSPKDPSNEADVEFVEQPESDPTDTNHQTPILNTRNLVKETRQKLAPITNTRKKDNKLQDNPNT
jgi:hypothetical protein